MNIIYKKYIDKDYDFVYNLTKEVYIEYVIKYYNEFNEKEQRDRFYT